MTSPPPPTFPPSFGPSQIRLGLGPIKRLLARLGDPQERYRTVLVAGTNGKGSVAAMLAEILNQGGIRAGLYTSPHLIDFRERIRVGSAHLPGAGPDPDPGGADGPDRRGDLFRISDGPGLHPFCP